MSQYHIHLAPPNKESPVLRSWDPYKNQFCCVAPAQAGGIVLSLSSSSLLFSSLLFFSLPFPSLHYPFPSFPYLPFSLSPPHSISISISVSASLPRYLSISISILSLSLSPYLYLYLILCVPTDEKAYSPVWQVYNSPQSGPQPNPPNCDYVILHGKRIKVADIIKVATQMTLRWKDYPGLSTWGQCVIISILIGGRERQERENQIDCNMRRS